MKFKIMHKYNMLHPKNIFYRLFILSRISASIFLIIAIFDLPYDYYIFLRIVVCAVGAFGAYFSSELDRVYWVWIFGLIALLFNPVEPFHLTKSIWVPIDFSTALVFVISIFILKEKKEIVENLQPKKIELTSRYPDTSNSDETIDIEIKIKNLTPENFNRFISKIRKNTEHDKKEFGQLEYEDSDNTSADDYLEIHAIECLLLMGCDENELISNGFNEDLVQKALSNLQS